MRSEWDYIVIGVGGVGSATLYWLARNAPHARILGIEQFLLGHVRGGSQDFSRIVRKLYATVDLTTLAKDSFEPWFELERESGLKIVHQCGLLLWSDKAMLKRNGTASVISLDVYKSAMESVGSKSQILNAAQIRERWPQFTIPDTVEGLYDDDGGLADGVLGNAAHQQCALARGVSIIDNTKVMAIIKTANGKTEVVTKDETFSCKKVIVSSGAWINQVLSSCKVHIPVKVSQENVSYYATPHLKQFTKESFPSFIYIDDGGIDVYGCPVHANGGFKTGLDAAGPPTTGDTRTWIPDPKREAIVTEFLKKYIPKSVGRIMETRVCLYTMTMDRKFLIDDLSSRGYKDILVVCGAGHAYKFAALFGKILSELAIFGKTEHDIDAFKFDRPAITDPNFEPTFNINLEQNSAKL